MGWHLKRMVGVCSVVLAVAAASSWARGAALTLIEKGKSDYVIVTPDKPANAEEAKLVASAAQVLQTTLGQATGVKLAIVPEGKVAGRPGIFLGQTAAAKAAGLDQVKGWTFIKAVQGKNLFLVGHDEQSARQRSMIYQGTLKAVTSFLEDEGVRYLLPGQKYGTYVPKLERVDVPGDLNETWSPWLSYIHGRRTGDQLYSTANNYLDSDHLKDMGGHSYYSAVPAKEYAKTHPEYFVLKNGVRSPSGNHLCISNPQVKALMLKQMEGIFDAGYDQVQLGQTDGYIPCQCDACKAINPDPKERTWIFHRELAAEMNQRRPGKKVVIISYGPTAEPPRTFKTFPPNVMIQLAHYSAEDFKAWQSFDVKKTVYIYNWGTYQDTGFGPKRTPKYAAEQIKLFRDNKVRGIYLCGGFEDMGLEGPVFYTYGRMIGNPDQDWRKVVGEFYRDAYGKSAGAMTDFFQTLYGRMELYSDSNRPNHASEAKPSLAKGAGATMAALFPRDVLAKLEQSLKEAEALDSDAGVQARIRLVRREFEYVKSVAGIYYAYAEYQARPDWETFGAVEQAVEARTKLIDSWYDDKGRMRAFDGWPRFYENTSKPFLLTGGRLRGPLEEPANWNFQSLREAKILPGATKLRVMEMDAARVSPFEITGRADNPAWQGAAQGAFVEQNLRKLDNETKFRVAYDEENLYLAFDCARDDMAHFNPVSAGRDGAVWRAGPCESIEVWVYLGRLGAGKYCRFFFNPVRDSFFDGRYGFITDGLDPRYGKWDDGWDGKWSYAFHIDRDRNRWTGEVKIPFSTLGLEGRIKPGSELQLKLRRLNFLYDAQKLGWSPGAGAPVVSGWTPTLGYKDFGRVHFK